MSGKLTVLFGGETTTYTVKNVTFTLRGINADYKIHDMPEFMPGAFSADKILKLEIDHIKVGQCRECGMQSAESECHNCGGKIGMRKIVKV